MTAKTREAYACTIIIPRWRPATVNELLRGVRTRMRRKRDDRDLVTVYALKAHARVAKVRRRVSLQITLGPRNHAPDPDNLWKSVLDALVHARLLVDDSQPWCETGTVTFTRGAELATTITLEDLPV